MLDGDVLPLHDDRLDEQADEPLAPGEVERLQAVADGCGEGLEFSPQPLQACTLSMGHPAREGSQAQAAGLRQGTSYRPGHGRSRHNFRSR